MHHLGNNAVAARLRPGDVLIGIKELKRLMGVIANECNQYKRSETTAHVERNESATLH